MKGITFGSYHSYNDLHLILTRKEIGDAVPKTKTVEIEGADGVLDYTEYFGDVKYNNRTLKFDFTCIENNLLEVYSDIQDKLNGQKVHITLDEDDDYYYIGRLSVSAYTNEKNIATISISCDCDPYKYKQNETTVSRTLTGTATTVNLSNSRKKVSPKITANSSFTIVYEGNTYSISSGVTTLYEIVLDEGTNQLTVTGTGTISFEYQEGRL